MNILNRPDYSPTSGVNTKSHIFSFRVWQTNWRNSVVETEFSPKSQNSNVMIFRQVFIITSWLCSTLGGQLSWSPVGTLPSSYPYYPL